MIERRPKHLEDYRDRLVVPSMPFKLSWEWAPERIRASLFPLYGVQPITRSMSDAAGGSLYTAPTCGEIEYFRREQVQFQMIHIVMSLAWWEERDGAVSAVPYAISILPSSKRGEVSTVGIDYVAALSGAPMDHRIEVVYGGFDPFRGDFNLFAMGGDFIFSHRGKMPLDELGIVIGRYFLALNFDQDEVLEVDNFLPDERSRQSYRRSRIKMLFTPLKKVEARRVWGIETPIELFLFQELLSRGLRPETQYLVYPDGNLYPSLYDVYADIDFRRGVNLLTEADFYFPAERLAVFCDGATHLRKRQATKDQQIVAHLSKLGIRSVRISSAMINDDLKTAGDRVCEALGV